MDPPKAKPTSASGGTQTYHVSRWLFLRLLGVVFLIAFISLWVQIDGLVGSSGILPAEQFLDMVKERLGGAAYARLPTLFWFGASDFALHAMCAAGVVLSLLLIVGVAPLPVLFLLWAFYLSLSLVGQTFFSFQWDTLLLETTLLAMFFAPRTLLPRLPGTERPPPRVGLWLLRLLLFKLMVLSGIVKLLVLDETWWGLTALDFHYFTQPLPAWTSWYAHHLPGWFQKLSVFLMFLIEIAAPFLIFCGRRCRMVAAGSIAFLMLLIGATGNYNFFNLLTITLCIPLLDDALLCKLVPGPLRSRFIGAPGPPRSIPLTAVRLTAAFAIVLLLGLSFVEELDRTRPSEGIDGVSGWLLDGGERYLLSWGRPLLGIVDPFRSINGYGLFRGMTTRRPELVIEGSRDGENWVEYEFRWKPGDLSRRPAFIQPHQPRLDWQMWFAALNLRRQGAWVQRLLVHLLEGTPEVLALLGENPFPESPPRYVRLLHYTYEFTTPDEREASGNWWKRGRPAEYRPMSLPGTPPAP